MRKALPQRIPILLPMLFLWAGTVHAQPRFSAFAHEVINLQSPDFSSYDSFIYLYPANTRLKHFWYTSVLSPDSQAVLKEKFTVKNGQTQTATLEYLGFTREGDINCSSMKTWSNAVVDNFQKTSYTRINDSTVRMVSTIQKDPQAKPTTLTQVDVIQNGNRRGVIYYRKTSAGDFVPDNGNFSTFNGTGDLIYFENGPYRSGILEPSETREYRYEAGRLTYKKKTVIGMQTTIFVDSNIYDPSGNLTRHFDWYKSNIDPKATGDLSEYFYSNGKTTSTYYYSRNTNDGKIFTITRDKNVSKDSFEYEAGQLVKFRQYETDFTHDTFRIKAVKYNTWENNLQTSERIMGWTFKGWDTLDFYKMTYNGCGKLLTKDRYLPFKYNLILNTGIAYSYDARCRLKTSLYTYPFTKTDRYTWYYDELEVHSPDMRFPFSVTLHPNPVKDQLQVSTDKFVDGAEFTVYDMRGLPRIRKKFTGLSDRYSLSVEQLPPGIYLYRINNSANIHSGRFVKL